MKMKQLIVACGMAVALFLSVGLASAQDNGNGGGNNNGGNGGNGGPGGGGGFNGGGGGGRRNFDPAQMMQRRLDSIRDTLGFTNDTDWSAVQPLVQKVLDSQRDQFGKMMRGMRGNRGGGPGGQQRGNRGGGMFGGTPSPEEEALQKGIDDDVPAAQVKELLTRYQAAEKTKEAARKTAQDNLRAVLSTKQEAQATLLGLLD